MSQLYKVDRALDDKQSHYEYLAFQIDREDGLVNYRLTWTLQLNGFLFAALALTGLEMPDRIETLLLKVLPIAGVTVSFAGLMGTLAANMAIKCLKAMWLSGPDQRWPRPFGGTSAYWLGLAPSVLLPTVLVMVWLYLFVRLW